MFKTSHFGSFWSGIFDPYHWGIQVTTVWFGNLVDQRSEIPDVFPGVHAGDLCCWQVVRTRWAEHSGAPRWGTHRLRPADLAWQPRHGHRCWTSHGYIYILHIPLHPVAYRYMPLTSTQSIWLIIEVRSNHESGLRRHLHLQSGKAFQITINIY